VEWKLKDCGENCGKLALLHEGAKSLCGNVERLHCGNWLKSGKICGMVKMSQNYAVFSFPHVVENCVEMWKTSFFL
jgi:hypothetical protein